MESKISSNFYVWDFVPKVIYDQFGAKSIWFIRKFQVDFAELVVMRFGKKVIINNWKDGGTLQNCGTRTPDTIVGGKMSQHKFMNADDLHVMGKTPEEIYNDIKDNFSIYSKIGLTTVEDIAFTTGKVKDDLGGWVHGDGRWTGLDTLLIVQP